VIDMNVAIVLQGASLLLLVVLLVCTGAFARQLRRLSSGVSESREERLERRVRERLCSEGFSDAEITSALKDSEHE